MRLRLGEALLVQAEQGEVVPGHVAADAGVLGADRLPRLGQFQQAAQARLGRGEFARLAQDQGLAEEQFGVFGEACPARPRRLQGLASLPRLVVRRPQPLVQRRDYGVIGPHALHGLAQQGYGLQGLAQLQARSAKVVQHKRVVRVLGGVELAQLQVAPTLRRRSAPSW